MVTKYSKIRFDEFKNKQTWKNSFYITPHVIITYHFRRKTRWELTRISAAVMGIEFAYAAETAFVSPTLLKIGKDDEASFHIQIEINIQMLRLLENT